MSSLTERGKPLIDGDRNRSEVRTGELCVDGIANGVRQEICKQGYKQALKNETEVPTIGQSVRVELE